MAGLAFSTATAVLKEDYKDLREQLNQNFFLLTQIEKNTDDVQGLRAYHAVHVSRSSGVGARQDLGVLPGAGTQGYRQALVPMRFNYGRIQISGPIIKAMASDRGSFLRAVRSEMDGISKDLRRDINRQLQGTSDGVIATTGVTTATTVITLAATTSAVQMRQLWADGGSKVDIGTVVNPTLVASGRNVTSYDTVAKTITVDGANLTTDGTHRVFRSGAGGASNNSGLEGDGQSEITGLQTIINNAGVLHTVDPAVYPVWKSTINANGGTLRAVSETLVNQQIHATEIASGEPVDILMASDGVSRAVAALMQSFRRNIDNVALKAGYSGIAWTLPTEGFANSSKARALTMERDTPANTLIGISTDALVEYKMADWDWMQEDGAILSRVPNTDAYEATYFNYSELACKQRNAFFALKDLTEA